MGTSWKDAPLVALDLEGTGAQDRENEAILEISIVPLAAGRPSLKDAYTTLINPGRHIPRRPWISPGLTDSELATAPALDRVEPELAARLNGMIIVGHNIGVDWRLLHRRCPGIGPAALIDTLRLARAVRPGEKRNSLTALLGCYQLTDQVTGLTPRSQPHRALWDAAGAALLLAALMQDLPGGGTFSELRDAAGLTFDDRHNEPAQLPLWPGEPRSGATSQEDAASRRR
jgi:DNA polymerase III subunit epsilon